MGEDDKINRTPDDLIVKLSPEEVKYRKKYLPDPNKLTNEKLICTVCSTSLAVDVYKGHNLFVHRFLQVLVCEACYNFYGDGCFSADEDGDDKYCRWCGQGGTLYLCCACTSAFCEKCVKQNLKESVIAEVENDDWKCYVCNPRPLFGTRTICWGAQELNKAGKVKELERLKKQKERLEKMEERKRQESERKSRKMSDSEGETSKKKRRKGSDSSPEVMPSKKSRRESRSFNGNPSRRAVKKRGSSSDETSEDEKKMVRRSRSTNNKNKKYVDSCSDEDSDFLTRRKSKSKKKKPRERSDESSDKEKLKSKQKTPKKNADTSDDGSSDEESTKKKKPSKKKSKKTSDLSSDEKPKKKRTGKKETSSEDSSDGNKNKSKLRRKKSKRESSSDEDSGAEEKTETRKKGKSLDDVNEGKDKQKLLKTDKSLLVEDPKGSFSTKDNTLSAENLIVKKRIKLAILWLSNTVKDISDLGLLISRKATSFGKKKINSEHLKTYEDVLNTVSKLKDLLSGVHSNYEHIEKNLDSQLKPWKIVAGLEEAENDFPAEKGNSSINDDVGKLNDKSSHAHVSKENNSNITCNDDDMNLQLSGGESDDQKATDALIFKARESLDKLDEKENALPKESTPDQDNKTPSPSVTRSLSKEPEAQENVKVPEKDDSMECELNGKSKKSKDTCIEGTDSDSGADVSVQN